MRIFTKKAFPNFGLKLCILFVVLLYEGSYAQTTPSNINLTGRVTDDKNLTLPGVSIKVEGSTNGTVTDINGDFRLTVPSNARLTFSYIGYTTQTIAVAGRTKISVSMTLNASGQKLNEVVVVGYGTQKRSDITGSVSSVPKERLSELPVTNVLHAIEGSVAGVNITTTSSAPGSSASALVRGVNSISLNTGPFVVLDGIPYSSTGGSINDINPNDIASIEILKDPSAVAIYGTRGANGVILITTKRGTSGKPQIRYNVYGGFENFAHTVEPMGPAQYLQKYADWKAQNGLTNTNPVPTIAETANYATGTTTDWIKQISRQGYIQDHNLSISGGTPDVKYFVSGDYLKQEGVLKGYQYNRFSLRSNLDVNITSYLTTGLNLFATNNNYDGGRVDLYRATQISPYGQLYNPDGSYYIYPMYSELNFTSPLLGLNTDQYNRNQNLNGSVYAEIKPAFLKGLKYRINATYNFVPGRTASYTGRNANNLLGLASITNSQTNFYVIENLLTYNKDWAKNHIDVTALYSAQQNNYFTGTETATGFINDLLSYNNLGAGATQTSSSSATKSNLVSQMLRVNYSFDSRYLLTVTARRDGYSAFGANNSKYGLFPSAALGWNIKKEKFMDNVQFVDNLKLRGGYGLVGNQAIPINNTETTSSTARLPYNGLSTIGTVASNLGNADLRWESTYGVNLGIDFELFKGRIGGTVEGYHTYTKDLVLYRALPVITGYTRVYDNIGKVDNKGLEVTLRTININAKDFKWETNLNYAVTRNKIISLYGDNKSDIGNTLFIGQPVGVIYDYKLQGVWQTGESTAGHDATAKAGDLKFADTNGDGKITADDKIILGQTNPKWIGGMTNTFRYKNFRMSIFIQTVQGVTQNNATLSNADQAGVINIPADITYWTAANSSNTRPSIAYKNPYGYGYASDASFTRIKDATLSYAVPQTFLNKIKLSGLTIYASGRNLYTWTKWIGWDPENTYNSYNGSNNYPLVRTFVLGANISLK